jgi:hypothetical protein
MSPESRTGIYRTRALVCEQRAKATSDPTAKADWEELAIEWHLMANIAARDAGEIPLIED